MTDLSRLSRSNGDLSKMIDRIVAKGIRGIGIQDGYDSARRGHKLQAGLSGIMGEAFRHMIRDRTHAALESRAKEQELRQSRLILRKLLSIRLIPDQGGLWAEYQLQPAALLKGVGTDGSGGRIWMQYDCGRAAPAVVLPVRDSECWVPRRAPSTEAGQDHYPLTPLRNVAKQHIIGHLWRRNTINVTRVVAFSPPDPKD